MKKLRTTKYVNMSNNVELAIDEKLLESMHGYDLQIIDNVSC